MNDRDSERLSRYLDGELGAEEALEVERLLEASAEVRETYTMLQQVHALSMDAFPRTRFALPLVRTAPRPRLRRFAAVAAIAVVAGGLCWAAVQVFVPLWFAPEPAPLSGPDVATPSIIPDASKDSETPLQVAAVDPETPEPTADPVVAAPSGSLTGTVRNANGNPIANAEIRAVGPVRLSEDLTQPREDVLARVHADAAGRFGMDWPGSATMLYILADGYRTSQLLYTDPVRGGSVALHAVLERASQVTGTVVNDAGAPVAGCRVIPDSAVDAFRDTVETDESGAFAISAGYFRMLFFHHPDYALAYVEDASPDKPIRTTLGKGGSVRVRVVRGGVPVTGAVIGAEMSLPKPLVPLVVRRTDAQGYATYDMVPAPGLYPVVALTKEGDAAAPPAGDVKVMPGQHTECLIEIPERYPGFLQGKVLDVDGSPVAQAVVLLECDGYPRRFVPVSDDGAFHAGLPLGEVRVTVRSPEHRDQRVADGAQRRFEVTETSRNLYEEFRFEETARTRVVLVDETGEAVIGAFVSLRDGMRWWPYHAPTRYWLSTDSGQFDVPRGNEFEIMAFDPVRGRAAYLKVEEPGDEVRVVLDTPVGMVAGLVTDPQGNPLAGAYVSAGNGTPREEFGSAYAQTGLEGRVLIGPLAQGLPCHVTTKLAGYRLAPGAPVPTTSPSADPEPVQIVLAPMDSAVGGQVVAMDGTPANRTRLTLMGDDGRRVEMAVTDADGAFSMAAMPGTYTLGAYRRPFTMSEIISVTAPSENLQIVLPLATIPEEPVVIAPQGPEADKASNNLKMMGLVCKMFANEAEAERFPVLDPTFGVFLPDMAAIYPEYLTDKSVLLRRDGTASCYLGYAVISEEAGLAFLDAYETLGPEAIRNQDIQVQAGSGSAGSDVIYQLREGVEKVFCPEAAQLMYGGQSDIPVMWEVPGDRDQLGGFVLFMDGHVEWVSYPGPFPMTERFVTRLRSAMGLPELP
jgi:anti-sigma factor RsiW